MLQPLIDWMRKNVTGSNNRPQARRSGDSLALRLSDQGMFWVGTGNTKKMPYGTIHVAPMYVQYLEPAERRRLIESSPPSSTRIRSQPGCRRRA